MTAGLIVVFRSSHPSSTKKNQKNVKSWTPLTKFSGSAHDVSTWLYAKMPLFINWYLIYSFSGQIRLSSTWHTRIAGMDWWDGKRQCLAWLIGWVCILRSIKQLRSYGDGLESAWTSRVSTWDPGYKATHSSGGGTCSFVGLFPCFPKIENLFSDVP